MLDELNEVDGESSSGDVFMNCVIVSSCLCLCAVQLFVCNALIAVLVFCRDPIMGGDDCTCV
jgi:hypothetical protein